MKRECSVHVIHELVKTALDQAEKEFDRWEEAAKKFRQRELQSRIDKANNAWYNRLFRRTVTEDTVYLETWFNWDLELSLPYLQRNSTKEDVYVLRRIKRASAPGTETDRLLLEDKEYNLIKYYVDLYNKEKEDH